MARRRAHRHGFCARWSKARKDRGVVARVIWENYLETRQRIALERPDWGLTFLAAATGRLAAVVLNSSLRPQRGCEEGRRRPAVSAAALM